MKEVNHIEVAVTKTYLVSIRHDEEFDTEQFIEKHIDGITSNGDYFPELDTDINLETATSGFKKSTIIDVEEFEKWKDKKDLYNAVAY